MTIIPAIDLLGGECVRLYKGRYDQSKVYDQDPVATAEEFVRAGARRIHLVDLDAARKQGHNRNVIKAIRESLKGTIEVGGGIRTEKDVEELLEAGVDRLILGTILIRDPDEASRWIIKYGNVFVAGIDAMNGLVKVDGWEESGGTADVDLARKAADMGFISIVYTNIDRDGTLQGPDIDRTLKISEASRLPVIVSGGISGLADCESAAASVCDGPGIRGIITGKAIYEGKLDLSEAIRRVQTADEEDLW